MEEDRFSVLFLKGVLGGSWESLGRVLGGFWGALGVLSGGHGRGPFFGPLLEGVLGGS